LGVLSIAIEKVQVDLKELKTHTLFQYEARAAYLKEAAKTVLRS